MEVYQAYLYTTIFGILLSKIEYIFPFLLECFMTLICYQGFNVSLDGNDANNRLIMNQLKRQCLYSTRKSMDDKEYPCGIILLKNFGGVLNVTFNSGYSNYGIDMNGYIHSAIWNEYIRIIKHETNEEEVKEEKKEDTKSELDSDSDLETKTKSKKKLKSKSKKKVHLINQGVKKGAIKYSKYQVQRMKITSAYDTDQEIPEFMQEQYQTIQAIKNLYQKRKKDGDVANVRALISGVPGSGKSRVAYELAKDFKHSILVTTYHPTEPNDFLLSLLSSCREDENELVIILMDEFDIMYQQVEQEKIHPHRDVRTEITNMSNFLKWLDMIQLLDDVIILFTTNQPTTFFPERVTRKGRMDLIFTFHRPIVDNLLC
jgi:SpoVK/Ycf46/Vps4 family AAA+-type ATPase